MPTLEQEEKKTDKEIVGKVKSEYLDKDARRFRKWLSLAKSKFVFGFEKTHPLDRPTMGSKPRGFSIHFERIIGWTIPPDLVGDLLSGDFDLSVELSLSFYHMKSNSFFGSAWMGVPIQLDHISRDQPAIEVLDIDYREMVYLISRITDPLCVAVVELVISKKDIRQHVTAAQYGCGWTIIPLFTDPEPPDVTEGSDFCPSTTFTMFAGSPRSLLLLNKTPPDRNNLTLDVQSRALKDYYERLKASVKELKVQVQAKIYMNRKLLRAQRLIAENEIVGRFDPIAGLVSRHALLPGAAVSQKLPCIGETEIMRDRRGVIFEPAKPSVRPPMSLRVVDWQLQIPDRLKMEARMRFGVAKSMANMDPASALVLSRTLKIGVHNGHVVVGGEYQTYNVEADPDDIDLLVTQQTMVVNGYVPDELMALALVIEYEIGLPVHKDTNFNLANSLEATVKGDRVVATVVVGCGLFIPFDGKAIRLQNVDRGEDNSRLGVELELSRGELCSVLSPHGVFRDVVPRSGGEAGGDPDEFELPRVGFDLQCFHPVAGELKHGQSAVGLEAVESAAPAGGAPTTAAPMVSAEGEGDEAVGAQKKLVKPSSVAPDPEVMSVADSAVESLVEGDSESSTLRLDPNYYGDVVRRDYGRKERWRERERDRRPEPRYEREPSEGSVDLGRDLDGRLSVPRDKKSLLSRSLQAQLHSTSRPPGHVPDHLLDDEGPLFGTRGRDSRGLRGSQSTWVAERGMDPTTQRMVTKVATATGMDPYGTRSATRSVAPPMRRQSTVPMGINPHVRELSRAARARLGRHGFSTAIQDHPAGQSEAKRMAETRAHYQSDVYPTVEEVVDIHLEANDELSIHDINIQFAGFRVGNIPTTGPRDEPKPTSTVAHGPHSVYFTYQFYTCSSTKTEVMKLLPSEPGEVSVLARDEPNSNDEAPLALRYMIDTSLVSPSEAADFAEYLAKTTLFIEVWDAHSLLLIGVCGFPLRRIMRQGQASIKCALECDVIDAENPMEVFNGISNMVVSEGGPVLGQLVGAVQIIIANYGEKGKGKVKKSDGSDVWKRAMDSDAEGLNWRAMGVEPSPGQQQGGGKRHRPRNIVRARPLAEGAPDLSRALTDHRSRVSEGPSMRSMTSVRGVDGIHTLTYDDVMTLFRRFKGALKGTVQYMGGLLKLLDVPSFSAARKKLVKAYARALVDQGSLAAIERSMRPFCNSEGEISMANLREFFRVFTGKQGVPCKPEELQLLAQKFVEDDKKVTIPRAVLDYCADESKREQWTRAGKRLRRAVQRATLAGVDPEQMLSDRDTDGDHYISGKDFKGFIMDLATYSKISQQDANIVVQHFSRRPSQMGAQDRNSVSLREVMSFFGLQYVGNLQVRMARALMGYGGPIVRTLQQIFHALKQQYSEGQSRGSGSRENPEFSWLETGLGYLGVYEELSHEQVRKVLTAAKSRSKVKLTPAELLDYVGISVPAEATAPKQTMTVEGLLRLLVERTSQMGLAVDNIFRSFDVNGDGSITIPELIDGLAKLKIFDSVPQWRTHIPELVKKFDKDGDGNVSLKEFFKFLGVEYSPNVIQNMTKIFAVAIEQGASMEDIYNELDENGDKSMSATELLKGLTAMGKFPGVTLADAEKVIKEFDKDGDGSISMEEFIKFFSDRVKQAQAERGNRQIAQKFRDVLQAAIKKGLTIDQIFAHFDKDAGGSVSSAELAAGLKKMSHFSALSDKDIRGLVAMIDADGSGDVSLVEFRAFLDASAGSGRSQSQNSLILRLQTVMRNAEKKGLSVDQLFKHLDKDGGGTLSKTELAEGLRKIPHFKDLTDADISGLVNLLDADNSGDISVQEFRNLLDSGTSSAKSAENSLLSRIRTIFQTAMKKGLTVERIFSHFDKDDGGTITADELAAGLRKMPHFKDLTDADIALIVTSIDADKSGDVTLEEFRKLIEGFDESQAAPGAASTRQQPVTVENDLITRLRTVFQAARKKGLTTVKIFAHFDKDGGGTVSAEEFAAGLRKMPHFKELSNADVQGLVELLDADRSGDVSLAEFKVLVEGDGPVGKPPAGKSAGAAGGGGGGDSELVTKVRTVFQNARKKGLTTEKIFAHFDKDGGGTISADELAAGLRKMPHFKELTEGDVRGLVKALDTDGNGVISLGEFKDMVEGAGPIAAAPPSSENSLLKEKIQTVFQNARKKGLTTEKIFAHFDKDGGGTVSAEEFAAGLRKMPHFKELSDQEVQGLVSLLDTDRSGDVSLAEFKVLVEGDGPVGKPPAGKSASAAAGGGGGGGDSELVTKVRTVFQNARKKGLTTEKIFAHFDKDGGGTISSDELAAGLRKMPHFKELSEGDVRGLVKALDTDGNGVISLGEFKDMVEGGGQPNAGVVFRGRGESKGDSEDEGKDSGDITTRLRTVFQTARKKGLTTEKIFAHFDKDGGGTISSDELAAGLRRMPHFKELTEGDVRGLVKALDTDGNGVISLDEFVDLVEGKTPISGTTRGKKSSQPAARDSPRKDVLDRLLEIFRNAERKGLSVDKIFSHFDVDGGGSVTSDELARGLRKMPHFRELSDDDVESIVQMLDRDGSGDISLEEFRMILTGDESRTSAVSAVVARLQTLMKNAERKGLSLEQIFAHFDVDKDGSLTTQELFSGLRRLPHFKDLSTAEVRNIVHILDSDESGEVSLQEFKSFIRDGIIIRSPKDGTKKPLSKVSKKELFLRSVRRVAEPDGGIPGLIAFLDDDEDGLISKERFIRMLGREGVFEIISETDVNALIAPLLKGTKDELSAIGLLKLLDGGEDLPDDDGDKSDDDDGVPEDVDYEFSNDPDTRTLEKKLRGVGRILAKKGMDVESLFRSYDVRDSGSIRRTEFVEALSRMGLYLLETGKVMEAMEGDEEGELRRQQMRQIRKLKGGYAENAARAARKLVIGGGEGNGKGSDFKEHLESMALVEWYRQSQKRMLLQRVLSHSLATTIRIYPRFGKTLYFEHPITNPFGHEERFQIDVSDAELKLVTSLGEWLHLRQFCRPCVGELGLEPVEAEIFDRDGYGNIQVALLPHETLYIPFTFLSLVPLVPPSRIGVHRGRTKESAGKAAEDKGSRRRSKEEKDSKDEDEAKEGDGDGDEPVRCIEVRAISTSHGHVVSVLKVEVCPRPFVLQRVFRFYETENSIMKRRLQLVGFDSASELLPGDEMASSKYIHCVETNSLSNAGDSRVVVEWGPSAGPGGPNSMDVLLRYRCPEFPNGGDFFLLIYDDPYQAKLHEIWQVMIQTRQRIDLHSTVGTSVSMDLVVRGDRFARRGKTYSSAAYAGPSGPLTVSFAPESVFHLVSGAYNRIVMTVSPKQAGTRRAQINLVDADSRELVSSWLATVHATPPVVLREYEVELTVNRPMHKKIIFKNPWDIPRRFNVTSSDETVMRHRTPTLLVAPQGSAYLRLWFAGARADQGPKEAYLFLNDEKGQNEECFLFVLKLPDALKKISDQLIYER